MPYILRKQSASAIAILLVALIRPFLLYSQCVATATLSGGNVTGVPFTGSDFSFSNPTNISLSDNSRANSAALLTLFNGETEYLQATGFGFSIPPTSLVCGIKVDVERSAGGIGTVLGFGLSFVTDHSVRLVRNGVVAGDDKATATHWTTAENYHTYGSNSDIWGVAWSAADINSPDFGVAISANISGLLMLLPNVMIDHIRITVYYFEGILPQHLLDFRAGTQNNETVAIGWKTARDPAYWYHVQRSQNGITWENVTGEINKVAADYTTSYKMVDNYPLEGRSWYRLAIVHASGNTTWSGIRAVDRNEAIAVSAYPNPFTSYLEISGVRSGQPICLMSMCGQRLAVPQQWVSSGVRRLDLGRIQPGIYFLTAGNKTIKVVKK